MLSVLDGDQTYVSQNQMCEPQLGRRGLYSLAGGRKDESLDELSLLWVFNLWDGGQTLLDIAERAGLAFSSVRRAADALVECELLQEAT